MLHDYKRDIEINITLNALDAHSNKAAQNTK